MAGTPSRPAVTAGRGLLGRAGSRLRTWGVVTVLLATASGCTAPSSEPAVPAVAVPVLARAAEGSRPFEYTSFEQLAGDASAVVVARPTGEESSRPLPGDPDAPPVEYVRMTVDRVLSGSLDAGTIEVVSPGDDVGTGESVLLGAGSVVLFLAPAMFVPDQPAGGYVVVGGPAGMYVSHEQSYVQVDTESPRLPERFELEGFAWPAITATEADLLRRGPAGQPSS